jgi:hypothetical protein
MDLGIIGMIPGINLLFPPSNSPGASNSLIVQQKLNSSPGQSMEETVWGIVSDEAFLILMGIGGSLVTINLLTKR